MSSRLVDARAFVEELRTDHLLHSKPCAVCDVPPPMDEEAEEIVLAALYEAARNALPVPTEAAPLRRESFTSPLRQDLALHLLRRNDDDDGDGPLAFVCRAHANGDHRRVALLQAFIKRLVEEVPAAHGRSLALAVERVRRVAALRAIRACALTVAGLAAVGGVKPIEMVPRLVALTEAVRGLR